MKKKYILLGIATLALALPSKGKTITASEAFETLPAKVMTLLDKDIRKMMISNYTPDSVTLFPNALEGVSYLCNPMTENYLCVQITPVSQLAVRVLRGKKRDESIVVTSYTLGDSLTAHDSELMFYNADMQPLKREKYIKIADSKDFFDFRGATKEEKHEALKSVPFPTVEYSLSPDSDTITARLTIGQFMGKEEYEKLQRWILPEILYYWDGSHYTPAPHHAK